MSNINQIVKGTINNILSKEENLYKKRITICKKCKLLTQTKIFGEVCNSKIYLNPNTDEISSEPKLGFKRGCGCVIGSKTRVRESHCPLGKW